MIAWLLRKKRRAVRPVPFRAFCPFTEQLKAPEEVLRNTRSDACVRAVMQVLEARIAEAANLATDERTQQLPGVAAHRAGVLAGLLDLHDEISAIADGRTRQKPEEDK